ncbi:hypothetical protein CRG98_027017 [Punica granatum]|uniref:Uncharacterized protein n=1 Tax=Punica granatum TaxID=22663 RepID=A0A2I0J8N0_PUNGR|nr:hypothetical protein CRG98_027017 [Punica granatum]
MGKFGPRLVMRSSPVAQMKVELAMREKTILMSPTLPCLNIWKCLSGRGPTWLGSKIGKARVPVVCAFKARGSSFVLSTRRVHLNSFWLCSGNVADSQNVLGANIRFGNKQLDVLGDRSPSSLFQKAPKSSFLELFSIPRRFSPPTTKASHAITPQGSLTTLTLLRDKEVFFVIFGSDQVLGIHEPLVAVPKSLLRAQSTHAILERQPKPSVQAIPFSVATFFPFRPANVQPGPGVSSNLSSPSPTPLQAPRLGIALMQLREIRARSFLGLWGDKAVSDRLSCMFV